MAASVLPSEVIMKMVWPNVWPGADMAWMPGRNSWPSLKKMMRSRLGSRFLRTPSYERLHVGWILHVQLLLVGPEIEVGLRDVDLRVREMPAAVIGHDAPDVVAVGVRAYHRIDGGRIDAGGLERGRQLAGGRPNMADVPMPVSNRTSLSPVLSTSTFCSSTTLVGERKLSVSILLTSSFEVPRKLAEGSPSGKGPSDTTVAWILPWLKR